jgi:hypothetical protein
MIFQLVDSSHLICLICIFTKPDTFCFKRLVTVDILKFYRSVTSDARDSLFLRLDIWNFYIRGSQNLGFTLYDDCIDCVSKIQDLYRTAFTSFRPLLVS